jgi:hypothetical protein
MNNKHQYESQLALTINNKKELIENIQKWALVDSQLKKITEKSKEYRAVKSELANKICTYMQENNMQNTKIDTSNGNIKIFEKKDYSALTFGYVEECLGKIIPDKSHVEFIIKYLKDSREIKTQPDLRRTYNKNICDTNNDTDDDT